MSYEMMMPCDALGDPIAPGDRVAFALGPAELVIGTVVELVHTDNTGAPLFYRGYSYTGKTMPSIKVQVERRANQWSVKTYEHDKQKKLVYAGPSRMVRLERPDVAAFVQSLRDTEKGLR